ncbi:MAG: aldo/keto reductase [Anaerolineae bacterium]|nr:aldo/keto reductase [Anaerolineae bacterium]
MQKRVLGCTGLEVSILGMGGFHFLEISAADARTILNRYLDAGGNYVETAPEYGAGESERKIGQAMASRRDEYVLATKVHLRDRDSAAQLIDQSLRHLRADHVDILFMHHVQKPTELERILSDDGALRAVEAARDAGKTRFIGISNHGHPELVLEALNHYPFDVVMSVFNYYDRFNFPVIEEELLPRLLERNIGIVGMKVIADGLLWRSAEQAFHFAWSLPIHVMVAGINTPALLEQDLAYAESFVPMPDEEMESWFAEAPELGVYICRQCDKCLPCPAGIDIPRVFETEGWYDRQMWDGVVRNPGDFWLRSSLRFWFDNQERARAAYGALVVQAPACADCGECEVRCPYRLPVTDKLRHAHYKLSGGEVLY